MNPKIIKLREEHDKNKAKISNLQGRNRELEKQIRELENTEIIGLVRAMGMSPEALAELMDGLKAPTDTSYETEDSEYEEV